METARDVLLSTAARLFAEEGFDRVSIRQISEAAGTNSAMISYYFGSKRGLYEAVLDHQTAMIRQFLQDAAGEEDPREVIRRYGEAALRIHEENPYLLYYFYREIVSPEEAHPLFQKLAPLISGLLAGAVSRGIAQGIFRADLDVFSAVIQLAGMINAYFLSRRMHRYMAGRESAPDEAAYIHQAVEVFLQGIERRTEP